MNITVPLSKAKWDIYLGANGRNRFAEAIMKLKG